MHCWKRTSTTRSPRTLSKNVTEKAVGEEVLSSLTPAQQVIKIVRDELTELMGSTDSRINFFFQASDHHYDVRPAGKR